MGRCLATLMLVACARVAIADTAVPEEGRPAAPSPVPMARGAGISSSVVADPPPASVSAETSTGSSTQLIAAEPTPQRTGRSRRRWLAAGSVAAFHGVYLTWQYFAWYRKGSEPFHTEGPYDAFGVDAFSGGADKLGHFWGNYAMTRGTTAVLVAGGFPKLPSSVVSFGLTELAFLLIEIQDGMAPYGFGTKDLVANLLGGGLGVLMDNVPAIDRYLDFRLEYWPSRPYRRALRESGDVDGAQDYTGQSYMVAFHTGAIPGLAAHDYGYWSRFVDVVVGFEAKHYYPVPAEAAPRQTLYGGLAINMQGVLSAIFDDSRGRRIGRGLFEVYSLPLTTLRYVESSRSPP